MTDHGQIREPIPITTTFDFPGWEIERWVGPCHAHDASVRG